MTENHDKPWTDDDLLKMFQVVMTMVGPYAAWKKITVPYDDAGKNKQWIKEIAPAIGLLFGRTGSAIGWQLDKAFVPTPNLPHSDARKRACLIAYKAGFLTLEECLMYMEGHSIKVAA